MRKALRFVGGVCALPEMFSVVLLAAALSTCALAVDDFEFSFLISFSPLYTELGLLALGMTLVIIAGEIDLSVASMLALVACLIAWLHVVAGLPYGLCLVLAPVLGGALGGFNGWVVNRFKVPSLVVTLATLALYRGLAQILVGDESLSIPARYANIDSVEIPGTGVPVPLLIFILAAIAFFLLLHKTVAGRRIFAVGENREAALFAGIRTRRVVMSVFVIAGVLAGISAILINSRLGIARFDHATGMELDVITAVLIGGVIIEGGRGTIFGTVIAVAAMMVIKVGMLLESVSEEKQLAVVGLILIVSVVNSKVMARFKR